MRFRGAAIGFCFLCSLIACSNNDDVVITGAWIRETPPGVQMTAGYFVFDNKGTADLVITGVETDDFEAAEIHTTRISDGTAKMRQIGQLTIPAGAQLIFEPGGSHLMLIRPTRDFAVNQTVGITLILQDGRRVPISFAISRNVES